MTNSKLSFLFWGLLLLVLVLLIFFLVTRPLYSGFLLKQIFFWLCLLSFLILFICIFSDFISLDFFLFMAFKKRFFLFLLSCFFWNFLLNLCCFLIFWFDWYSSEWMKFSFHSSWSTFLFSNLLDLSVSLLIFRFFPSNLFWGSSFIDSKCSEHKVCDAF